MSSLGINNTIVPTIVTPKPTSSIPKMPKSNPYVSTHNSSLAKYKYIKEEGVITIYNTKNPSNNGSPDLIPKYQIKVPTSSDPNVCIQDYYNNSQIYWNAFPRLNEVTTTTNNDTTNTTTITPLPNNSVNKHQFLGDNLNVKNHRFSNLSTASFDSVSSNGSACTFNSSSSSLSLNGLNNNGMDGINKLIKPTSTWEISNLSTPSTLVKYESLLGGYVVSWNGRMFLWKIGGTPNNNSTAGFNKKNRNSFISSYSSKKNTNVFSNGSLIPGNDGKQSDLYCVEGLSGLGARVAEFERETNILYINVSNKILDADSYNSASKNNSKEEELLTSFESFILVTGLIAKNSARKLIKKLPHNPNDKYTEPHLFNYSPFFMFCGFCT
ncbi:hypothetical protein RhiirA5_396182 [Rhizophagus irregularis]|uniref:Uncharacterized protein n=3 Tax=Rhizophagus irregularis TaxID=588596 RepID=U9SUW1_RHIID|nr:hypothetical protein GLOIN_2v1724602 [Rhizophagus irregularis DAOM 181602=DAOM 197198]EXX61515.1 hypothetical protein RirG_170460 [Rhizophagus irregularis DAOM 197198w]PKC13546.1 hypothetical protein RhiirA5_396182 [Rhizophagus irregularis]PKC68704.1 hypothetical protein RhiirA1_416655 [Rhizophagus irregularis]PKK73713.1 hypothetical protein RhiirC2_740278 [Rhizophagus irregularis]PKY16685.1 hypothetical protein RhiirB3_521366 [Rhizophagus irregularis]|eukprot:XP_025166009.1 hypothetical protein GLOIN_2v1724602 [Rhizophagus irregularis DAOM 181602=DAOM 197198]